MSKVIRILVMLASALYCNWLMADTVVYEVSKGPNKLYLAGTIHLLRDTDFPLPKEFQFAYKKSAVIYFETDLQKAKSPEFAQKFTQSMVMGENKTLKDVLSPLVWNDLEVYATKSQFPLAQTKMFNPAMISIVITMFETKKMGVGEGADAFYDKTARNDNKPVKELETGEEVIASMQAFAQEDADKIISGTLKDVESLHHDINTVIAEWKKGDLAAIEKDLGEKMQTETPIGYRALVVERNNKWLPKIEALLTTAETEMVMVGSLHLTGKQGLLARLKADGYTVKPCKINN